MFPFRNLDIHLSSIFLITRTLLSSLGLMVQKKHSTLLLIMLGGGLSSASLNHQRSLDGLMVFQVQHHLLLGMVLQMMKLLPVYLHLPLLSCQGLLIRTEVTLLADLMEMEDYQMLEVNTTYPEVKYVLVVENTRSLLLHTMSRAFIELA